MRVLFLCLLCRFLFAFQDEELDRVWSSIADINRPTVEDYQNIETYLNQGKRPYLEALRRAAGFCSLENNRRRLINVLNFKMLGPNQELPVFEIHHLNPGVGTKERCILLYASYNGIYPQKARRVLREIEECGYSGDVFLRIGGFPNVENGGLKICHVPYSFKVAFFQEAKMAGYSQIFWIDTAMHPLDDLSSIFSSIKNKGVFVTYAGTLLENAPGHLMEAAIALNIRLEHYEKIPHLHASMIGLNMDNPNAVQLLNDWYEKTVDVYPNVTWFPEELSLSVVAWRLKIKPTAWFGHIACGEEELSWLPAVRPSLRFYCDTAR